MNPKLPRSLASMGALDSSDEDSSSDTETDRGEDHLGLDEVGTDDELEAAEKGANGVNGHGSARRRRPPQQRNGSAGVKKGKAKAGEAGEETAEAFTTNKLAKTKPGQSPPVPGFVRVTDGRRRWGSDSDSDDASGADHAGPKRRSSSNGQRGTNASSRDGSGGDQSPARSSSQLQVTASSQQQNSSSQPRNFPMPSYLDFSHMTSGDFPHFVEMPGHRRHFHHPFAHMNGMVAAGGDAAGPDGLDKAPSEEVGKRFVRVQVSREAEERADRQRKEEEKAAKLREKKAAKLKEKRAAKKQAADEATAAALSAKQKLAPDTSSIEQRVASPIPTPLASPAISNRPPSSLSAAAIARQASSASAPFSPAPSESTAEPWQIPRVGRFWGHDDRQGAADAYQASTAPTRGGRGGRGGAPAPARGAVTARGGRGGKGPGMRADWEEKRQGNRERPEARFNERDPVGASSSATAQRGASPRPAPESASSPLISHAAVNVSARPDTPAGRSEKSAGSGAGWTTVQGRRGGANAAGAGAGGRGGSRARGWGDGGDEWRHDGWEEMERESEMRGQSYRCVVNSSQAVSLRTCLQASLQTYRGRGARGGYRGAPVQSHLIARTGSTTAPLVSSAESSSTPAVFPPTPTAVPSSASSTAASGPASTPASSVSAVPAVNDARPPEAPWTTRQPVPFLFNAPGSRQYTDSASGKPVMETTIALGNRAESPRKGVRIELAKEGDAKPPAAEAPMGVQAPAAAPAVQAELRPQQAPAAAPPTKTPSGAVVKLPSTIVAPAGLRPASGASLVNGQPALAPVNGVAAPERVAPVPVPASEFRIGPEEAASKVIYTADPSNVHEPPVEISPVRPSSGAMSPGSVAGAAVLREALSSPSANVPPQHQPPHPSSYPPPSMAAPYPQNGPYYPAPMPYLDPVTGQPMSYPPPQPYGYGPPPTTSVAQQQAGMYQPQPGYYEPYGGPSPAPQTPPPGTATPGLYVPARSTKVRISHPSMSSAGSAAVNGRASSPATTASAPPPPRRKMSFGSSFRTAGASAGPVPYRSTSAGQNGPSALGPAAPVPSQSPPPPPPGMGLMQGMEGPPQTTLPYFEHNGMTFYQPAPPPPGMYYAPLPPSGPEPPNGAGYVNGREPGGYWYPPPTTTPSQDGSASGPPSTTTTNPNPNRLEDPSIVRQSPAAPSGGPYYPSHLHHQPQAPQQHYSQHHQHQYPSPGGGGYGGGGPGQYPAGGGYGYPPPGVHVPMGYEGGVYEPSAEYGGEF